MLLKKSDTQTQFNNERYKRIVALAIFVAALSILAAVFLFVFVIQAAVFLFVFVIQAAVFATELPVCPPNLTGAGKPVVNLGNLCKYNNT